MANYSYEKGMLSFSVRVDQPVEVARAGQELIECVISGLDGELVGMGGVDGATVLSLKLDYSSDDPREKTVKPSREEIVQDVKDVTELLETSLVGVRARLDKALQGTAGHSAVGIFVSHSDQEVELAGKFVALLERSLQLPVSDSIRCTSLSGYSHQTGAHTSATLRSDIQSAKCVVGLMTPLSLSSKYVLFELGASWGMENATAPIAIGDVDFFDLPGPMREMNVMRGSDPGRVWQLIEEIAQLTGYPTRPSSVAQPAVSDFTRFVQGYAPSSEGG